jgi:drug/metabolite transporter (DMT)-like permease
MTAISTTSHSRTWLGVVVALVAAAGYAVANTSTGVAYQGGSDPMTLAAIRFLVPTVALFFWLRLSGVPLALPRRNAILGVLLGFVTALYTFALLRAFSMLPFALAVLIFYLFPLLAAVIAATLGWEKFNWKTGTGIVLALVGLALALGVRGGGNLDAFGIALSLLAAVGLAIVIVVSSRLFGGGDARPLTLYMAVAASVLLLILCAATGDFAFPQTSAGWIGFVASSVVYGFAMIAFFIAVSMIGPVRASLLSYADAVISAGLGVVVLGQTLTMVQVVGIALVIIALVGATQR